VGGDGLNEQPLFLFLHDKLLKLCKRHKIYNLDSNVLVIMEQDRELSDKKTKERIKSTSLENYYGSHGENTLLRSSTWMSSSTI